MPTNLTAVLQKILQNTSNLNMKNRDNERRQQVLDRISRGEIDRRSFISMLGAAGIGSLLGPLAADTAFAAGQVQIANRAGLRPSYDYIIVGAGSAGSVLAGELSKTGAEVLLVEDGGQDNAPTISNPSVWFYNLGGPLDWSIPIQPSPRLANRHFKLALGHVIGGGSSINAMVWARGMQRDFDGWAAHGARGWSFRDLLPIFKAQEDWEGGANDYRGVGGPVHIRIPHDPHPTAPAFLEAARQMGLPIHADANGPMEAGAGYINMNIAADGTRVNAPRAFLRPNLGRQNLTLLTDTPVTKVTFAGTRCTGVELVIDGRPRTISVEREVVLTAGGVGSAKLLMLSGVGDASALRSLGIAPVADLPGVGRNYQDHVLAPGWPSNTRTRCPNVRRIATPLRPKPISRRGSTKAAWILPSSLGQLPAVCARSGGQVRRAAAQYLRNCPGVGFRRAGDRSSWPAPTGRI